MHANACGISILNSNIGKLHEYANKELENYDFNEGCYDVDFVRDAAAYDLVDLIMDLGQYEDLWGQQNPTPQIAVTNINIKPEDVQLIGKNKNTVRFNYGGVTYIQFFEKGLYSELMKQHSMSVAVVGESQINEWNGLKTPQIIIKDYSIRNTELEF